jgi:hypothetical protein
MSPLEWATERLANCERIAMFKSGKDREGWLEDAAHWRDIIAILADRAARNDESRDAGLEEAAQYHDLKASSHAIHAQWYANDAMTADIKPSRLYAQFVEGIAERPANGPAMAALAEWKNAAAIRALKSAGKKEEGK